MPFSFDKESATLPTNHPIQNQFSFAPFKNNLEQKDPLQAQKIYPQSCGSNLKINMGVFDGQIAQMGSNNNITNKF